MQPSAKKKNKKFIDMHVNKITIYGKYLIIHYNRYYVKRSVPGVFFFLFLINVMVSVGSTTQWVGITRFARRTRDRPASSSTLFVECPQKLSRTPAVTFSRESFPDPFSKGGRVFASTSTRFSRIKRKTENN